MTDAQQIQNLYQEMYTALIQKDAFTLSRILDDRFVLIHMTGMRQSKAAFIQSVLDGTLNYYSVRHARMPVAIEGDHAVLTGQSEVTAAVFGGGRGNWRLQQTITLQKTDGVWRMTESVASTY